jgi:hypothetical protein
VSYKPNSTKFSKRAKVLETRQAYYDKFLIDWSDCHRPGGTPTVRNTVKVFFTTEHQAIEYLRKLGFSGVNVGDKLIQLGNMSLRVLTAVDYLVNFCKYNFTKITIE